MWALTPRELQRLDDIRQPLDAVGLRWCNPWQQTRHFETRLDLLDFNQWCKSSDKAPSTHVGFLLNLCFVHDGCSEALPVWRIPRQRKPDAFLGA
jgi:hypothetical protein